MWTVLWWNKLMQSLVHFSCTNPSLLYIVPFLQYPRLQAYTVVLYFNLLSIRIFYHRTYFSTKIPWTNCTFKADFPTPPGPRMTSLYSCMMQTCRNLVPLTLSPGSRSQCHSLRVAPQQSCRCRRRSSWFTHLTLGEVWHCPEGPKFYQEGVHKVETQVTSLTHLHTHTWSSHFQVKHVTSPRSLPASGPLTQFHKVFNSWIKAKYVLF